MKTLPPAAATRYYVSMLKMIDPEQALHLVLERCHPAKPQKVNLEKCAGLVLAEEIRADRDYPPFNRASMDGYAVRLADAGKEVLIAGLIAAGDMPPTEPISDGYAWEIMTGAACPPGTEAVVQYEITERRGEKVLLPAEISPGKNIAPVGSECAKRNVVVSPGELITPLVIANLAAFGISQIKANPLPKMAIISTGAELADLDKSPGVAQIRDSNGPMLRALAQRAEVPVHSLSKAGDNKNELLAALDRTQGAGVVVLTGGVSMGRRDLVPDALAEHGVDLVFHKVTQKPGKPLLFGIKGNVLYFGLPGNPLAVHLGFHRYVEPAIRKIAGLPFRRLKSSGSLMAEFKVGGTRTVYQLAHVYEETDSIFVKPLLGRGSADIFASAPANAYIELLPECRELKPTDFVEFEYIGDQRWMI